MPTSGSYNAATSTLELLSAGGSIVIPGVGAQLSAGSLTVTNTAPGGANSGSLTIAGGALSIGLNVATQAGPAGQQGLPGPSIQPFTLMGGFSGATGVTSINTTLTAAGQGAASQQAFVCTSAGTYSLDGTTTWNALDIAVTTGSAWLRVPYGGSNGGSFTQIGTGATTIRDNGDGLFGFWLQDLAGNIWMAFDANSGLQAPAAVFGQATITTATIANLASVAIASGTAGTLTVTNLIATNYTGPLPTSVSPSGDVLFSTTGSLGQTVLPGLLMEVGNVSGRVRWCTLDRKTVMELDATTGTLYLAGDIVTQRGLLSGGQSTTTFGEQDFLANDTANLAYSATVRARSVAAQQPTCGYNLILSVGQSKSVGQLGVPALTAGQPLDNLMIGQDARWTYCAADAPTSGTITYIGQGDNNLHPLACQNLSGPTAAPITVKTGVMSNVGSVSVSIASGQGTFISAGAAFGSTFAAGDTFQIAGFTVAAGNNSAASSSATFTVVSSNTGTLVVAEGSQCQATTALETGIEFAHVAYAGFGETAEVTGINGWRQLNLDAKQVALDPSRVFVAANAGCSGYSLEQLSPGASPNVWLGAVSACAIVLAKGTAASLSSCLTLVSFDGGGSDVSIGTTYAAYKANFLAYLAAVNSQLIGSTGIFTNQVRPPFVTLAATDSRSLNDLADSNGVYLPITTAQAELCGCRPIIGAAGAVPLAPNLVMTGPDYQTPNHGQHRTGNGYRWRGSYDAVIWHSVIDKGIGWKPTHLTRLLYRGNQILLGFHVPYAPLQLQPIFINTALALFNDAGCTVTDAVGARTITSAVVVGQTGLLLTVSGAALSGPVRVIYGDVNINGSGHNGAGNICDTSPLKSVVPWVYLGDGQGQVLGENQPGPISATQPVANGQPMTLYNYCVNFSELATAG